MKNEGASVYASVWALIVTCIMYLPAAVIGAIVGTALTGAGMHNLIPAAIGVALAREWAKR